VLVLASGVVLTPAALRAGRSGAEGLEVGKVEVVGLSADLESFPRDRLALSPRRKILGTARTLLTQRTLDEDRERIRIYLVRAGYPDVQVTARATPDRKGKRASVVFNVVPGTRVNYGTVSLTGMPSALEEKARRRLADAAPTGQPFDQSTLELLRGELRDKAREAGYARADVKVQAQREADTADVVFTVAPGPSYVFGDVTVQGVEPDLASLAKRVIGTRPGEPASASRLKDVSIDLRRLNLFRKIEVTTAPVEPDTLDLNAQLSLQAMTTWEVSVGTFTDEWLKGSVAWTHRNLLGHGRSLHVEASASQHEVKGLTRTSWPAVVVRRSRTDLSVSYEVAIEENYTQRTAEAEIADVFDPWRRTSARLGLAVSRATTWTTTPRPAT
jgi:outer membrane protein assembly factor BamA